MKVRVIGGHGGVAPGFKATSYLIDGKLLVDAGSVATGISIAEQAQIEHILISHPHLDHIKDLAFICDNCFGMKQSPFQVYSSTTVKKAILEHLLNDILWPDFSKLPSVKNPTIKFSAIRPEEEYAIGEYKVRAVPVNHQGGAMGFIIEKDEVALLFTQDTGPTERIWELGKETKNLKGIFTEVSFPNHLIQVAIDSLHHTPSTFHAELNKMPPAVPIYLGHLKPNFLDILHREIADLKAERITVLGSDGDTFSF